MAVSTTLTGVPSLHPTISVSIPAAHLSLPSHCRPFLLQRLPPAVFLDPYAFRLANRALVHPSVVRNLTYLGLTELERAVGWSDPEGTTRSADRFVRKLQRQRERAAAGAGSDAGETEAADLEASVRALGLEHTGVLIELQRRGIREDPALAEKVVKAIKGEQVDLDEDSSASTRATTVSIPVHARYLPPVEVGKGGVASASGGVDVQAIKEQVLDPSGRRGLYEEVKIDRPELFWACEGDMTQEEAFKQGWSFVEPHQLLPQPVYSHVSLTPPFPAFNPHYIRFLRPNPTAEDTSPLLLRLPRGDASLGPILQALTFAIVGLASLIVVLQARRVVAQVRRVERGRTSSKEE
ncbi:hypothetical protein OC844_006425 [Tilletia horrida]|nr:hypothetical protein OC844_006425 [Tilletia horrida]